ncbi:MAG: hypothetical protein WC976_07235 [Caldisericia bacterium]
MIDFSFLKDMSREELEQLRKAIKEQMPKRAGKDCLILFKSGHARYEQWASCFVACRQWKILEIKPVDIVENGMKEKWSEGKALKREGGKFWVYFTQGLPNQRQYSDSVALYVQAKSGVDNTAIPDNKNAFQKGYLKGEFVILKTLTGHDAENVIGHGKRKRKKS